MCVSFVAVAEGPVGPPNTYSTSGGSPLQSAIMNPMSPKPSPSMSPRFADWPSPQPKAGGCHS
jgi:hypothetical protein